MEKLITEQIAKRTQQHYQNSTDPAFISPGFNTKIDQKYVLMGKTKL